MVHETHFNWITGGLCENVDSTENEETTTLVGNNEEIDLLEILLEFTIQGSQLEPPEMYSNVIEETTILPTISEEISEQNSGYTTEQANFSRLINFLTLNFNFLKGTSEGLKIWVGVRACRVNICVYSTLPG